MILPLEKELGCLDVGGNKVIFNGSLVIKGLLWGYMYLFHLLE
jgi:hypothetical protein